MQIVRITMLDFMRLGALVDVFLSGTLVGADTFGNRYYTNKKNRRWVVFRGTTEASKVPPEWQQWLNRVEDTAPVGTAAAPRFFWQKPHLPNLTGTVHAYRPPGHIMGKGARDKATGDYEPWQPK